VLIGALIVHLLSGHAPLSFTHQPNDTFDVGRCRHALRSVTCVLLPCLACRSAYAQHQRNAPADAPESAREREARARAEQLGNVVLRATMLRTADPPLAPSASLPTPAADATVKAPPPPPPPRHWVEVNSALALFNVPQLGSGYVLAMTPQVGMNVSKALAVYGRVAFAQGSDPDAGNGFVVSNPALGTRYSFALGKWVTLTPTLEVAFPVGMGGGSHPDPTQASIARIAGLTDVTIFNPNYLAVVPGALLQVVAGHFVSTASLAVVQLVRTRGAAVSPESALAFGSGGIITAYVVVQQFGLYANVDYLRVVGKPSFVAADDSAVDYAFAGGGVFSSFGRLDLSLGYARAIDRPLSDLRLQYVVTRAHLAF